ncbi:MAG TPA: MFS transporter [Candidatus Limiplasma sp.]|nr:MFS transporter [Candidatus Limiplasma sp.]HPS81374.1 MFS transporter [Candidatus Limiplasma sp.]
MKKLTPRLWTTLILIGLIGQFAWTIENMYFNVYLYNTITTDPNFIAWMVAASAVAATLTTLLMGAASDRAGNRKRFICFGYLLWGASTAAFGLLTVENAAKWFPMANAAVAAATMVVALDCVMTFFGSTANDAAFNAYITDSVQNEHRGRVESVLAILPLIAMLIIFGAFDSMTRRGEWQRFFAIFGGLVSLAGLVGFFLIPETPVQRVRTPFFQSLLYGFRPSVMRAQPLLYLSLCAMCVFSIAVQVFFPYLIIYMQHYLLMDNYAMVLGLVLIVASLASVLMGRRIDRIGKLRVTLVAAAAMLAGLMGMYFVRDALPVIIAGSVMMSGYMVVTAALSAEIRDRTPEDKAGHFQGIRMIFAVMLPMLIGPFIGAAVIRGNAQTYVELGVTKTVPTPAIFLAAGAALLFVTIPVLLLRRRERV